MSERIRIRVGQMELEYEGNIQFTQDTLLALVSKIANLQHMAVQTLSESDNSLPEVDVSSVIVNPPLQLSMFSVAKKLNCQTGGDLLLAAATYLMLVNGQDEFSREDLRVAMQEARGYWKKNMSNNLSGYIDARIKSDELLEIKSGIYTLPVNIVEQRRASLAI